MKSAARTDLAPIPNLQLQMIPEKGAWDFKRMDGSGHAPVPFLPRRVRLRDGDDLSATMRLWNMEVAQLGPDVSNAWMLVGDMPQVSFSAGSFGANVTKGVTRAGHLALHVDLGSDPSRRISGMELETHDIVAALGAVPFEYLARGRHFTASFSVPETVALSAMESRTAGSFEMRPGRLHRISGGVPRVDAIRQLFSAVAADDVYAHGLRKLRVSEFASGSLLDSIVGALLGGWGREHDEHLAVAHYQRMPIVRRAEEFMRANLGEPIMLHQICAAARASERAVEYAFRDVYGMGAKQYFKLLRLHRVRRLLKETPPRVRTITDIAQSYGFWHMGHFSTDYRRLFGETAQVTQWQAWSVRDAMSDRYFDATAR